MNPTLSTRNDERGIALIAAMMVMLLMSALMVGFTAIMISDQKFRGIGKDRNVAYYGAQSGLEKLTVDFGNLFFANVSPTNAQIAALSTTPPVITGVTFTAKAPLNPYGVTLTTCDPLGLQTTCNGTVQTGPYQGLIALKKTYQLDSIAVTTAGGETHLTRKMESVAIPVFQFGTFSDVDLSLYAGAAFTFGGRIHTNGNLFLAAQTGGTTTLTDKVTAYGDIIRQTMQNTLNAAANGFAGTISAATAPNTYRAIQPTEGSLVGGVGSAPNANWSVISLTTYNGYLRNGGCPGNVCSQPPRGTGVKLLQLPLLTVGGTNPDLVRRPPVGEDVNNNALFNERMYSKVSLRILLSDIPGDITKLPTVTATAPVALGDDAGAGLSNNWTTTPPAGYGPVDATHPPIALSPGVQTVALTANSAAGAGTISVASGGPYGNGTFPSPFNSPATLKFDIYTTAANMTAGVISQTIKCTGITATQFVSCKNNAGGNLLAVNAGYLIRGSIANVQVNGTVGSTVLTISANQGAGAGPLNYTVLNTAPMAANTFWMQDSGTLAWDLVYCLGVKNAAGVQGNNVDTWQNCTGVPAAKSNANGGPGITTNQIIAQSVSPIGGYIKIEIQKNNNTWQDVTMEILNWGIGAPNQDGQVCDDPSPNAILRIQRLRDNGGNCTYSKVSAPANNLSVTTSPYDYWPQAIFDTREALLRQPSAAAPAPATTNIVLGGVMYYVAIDVGNLSKWFTASAPYGGSSGPLVLTNNGGYSVYFSDRRNNRADGSTPTNCLNCETGEYGWEDVVNPLSATGTPNGVLDAGEDFNGNGTLETYGQFPSFQGVQKALPPGALAPLNAWNLITPQSVMSRPQALSGRAYLFRRALKLINAGPGSIVTPGFTVVAENPIYIQGDWNWNQPADPNATAAHSETSVIGDAVTLLSSAWTDANAFRNPYDATQRVRNTNSYRLAIIAGKPPAFAWPAAGNPDTTFGMDGGAHNFLRYLETGNAPLTTNFIGSIATFYYSRQATGTYKFAQNTPPNNAVYSAPNRNYAFDTDFLDPSKLPPLTPMFRDLNVLGFTQEMRPGK